MNVVEASIADLRAALESNELTSVGLVTTYLDRINKFDRNGPCLNAVPVLNPDALIEAQASDKRRHHGETLGPSMASHTRPRTALRLKG